MIPRVDERERKARGLLMECAGDVPICDFCLDGAFVVVQNFAAGVYVAACQKHQHELEKIAALWIVVEGYLHRESVRKLEDWSEVEKSSVNWIGRP